MLGSSDCLVSTGHIGRDCRAVHYQLTVTLCLRPYSFMVLFGDLHGHVVPRLYAWLHFAPSACAAYSMVTTLQPQLHRGLQEHRKYVIFKQDAIDVPGWKSLNPLVPRWVLHSRTGWFNHTPVCRIPNGGVSTARGQFGRRSDLTCRKSVGKGGWVWPAVSRSAIAPGRLWHSTGE